MIRRVALRAALRSLIAALGLSIAACASLGSVADRPGLAEPQVFAWQGDAALAGTRWGLLVVTAGGEPVIEAHADDRFIPASTIKIFTTAATFALLDGLDNVDPNDGTSVRLETRPDGTTADLVLIGAGDPALGDGPQCVANCLAALADAVAESTPRVRDVIGDDRLFPDERWGPGWSWEDMQESFGTAVSALTVNDNVVMLEILPGLAVGEPVRAAWRDGDDLQPLDNTAVTVADGPADLRIERLPGEEGVRLFGQMPVGSAATTLRIGLADPALSSARRFRRLLEQRGVAVEGEVRARHRPLTLADVGGASASGSLASNLPAPMVNGVEVARLLRPPLQASLVRTGKVSQNLHAELILRRLGRLDGSGSRTEGLARVEAVLASAGVARASFDLHDGSGMSAYNRVSPRAMTAFLLWTATQPWGEAWRATLPVGGRDGTLARRFVGTPLEGRIFAKTGTLNGVTALAGFLTAASGQTLVFSIYANDRPSTGASALGAMDRTLVALAAAN